MENIQVLRYMASLDARIKALDPNNQSIDLTEINNRISNLEGRPTVDLTEINNRLSNLEGRPTVDLSEINNRLSNLEGRPTVDLTEINNRISNLEARPDVMQRLSALELTVASLNSS